MSRESEVTDAIRATRHKFLMMQSPFGLTISPLSCLAVCLALSGEVAKDRLLIWLSVTVVLALARGKIWLSAMQEGEPDKLARHGRLLTVTMIVVAIWWGFGALLVLPQSMEGRIFLFCSIVLASGGTSSLYSIHPTGTVISVLAITVPISVTFLTQDEYFLKTLGFGALLFLTGNIRAIQTLNHFFVRSHELTYDLKESVQLLERSESMRRDLSLMLIHDLRTPLSGLITRAHLAREYCEEGDLDESAEEVGKVLQISQSLAELVNSILDVNRLEDTHFPIHLINTCSGDLIDSALEAMGLPAQGLEVEGSRELRIVCDVDLIRRVLINLVANALRYQPDDERIRLTVQEVERGVEFRIADSGPGIPSADRQQIFDKYATRESGNRPSGLGLTFCKLVVEAHNGTIGVDSEAGRGSEFWFRLP